MLDDTGTDRPRQKPPAKGLSGILQSKESDTEGVEDACRAFGYLRGIREQAAAVEFRFRSGNSVWFPYGWLGTCYFNPSEGLLIKFSGDLVYLILIRGSNLDQPLADTNTNLTSSGLQRHRIVWMREMNEEEIRQVGESGPTIDSIEVAEFETHAALKEWLAQKAPAFSLEKM
jgi:hypothetical protein